MINQDTIVFMAREAGMSNLSLIDIGYLEKFAALVVAVEREACANIVENADAPDCGGWSAQGIADDIRARNKE